MMDTKTTVRTMKTAILDSSLTSLAGINYLTTTQPSMNYEMEVLDAYYNGSFSLTLTPPQANSTFDCPQLKSQTIPNMFLRLGPQSNRNVDRKKYGDVS